MYIVLKNLPMFVHALVKKIRGYKSFSANYAFLNQEIINSINFQEKLKDIRDRRFDYKNSHEKLLNSHSFSRNFEMLDIDYSYNGIEERHPFCDIDLMNFACQFLQMKS